MTHDHVLGSPHIVVPTSQQTQDYYVTYCWFYGGPPPAALAQHNTSSGSTSLVRRSGTSIRVLNCTDHMINAFINDAGDNGFRHVIWCSVDANSDDVSQWKNAIIRINKF